ncbi:DUF5336 domain-containing protein [Rhodococcus spongiicola]|uniref:DUF5336 domain-containing protein n=1 Tax=Rhodococcus spongiicola TaxID=2487352 RepID=A0A438B5W2_9NOCA|nr:DUF5336 domain-containing protein [Rhodococcus spongiicola]RVW06337.1 hypothetical protein EF834_02560 [Rhodococcus spongiicola]
MTYSDGGSSFGQPPQPPAMSGARGLSFYLGLGVLVLGVVSFLLGFAPYLESSPNVGSPFYVTVSAFQSIGGIPLAFLLTGGLLAGISLLPEQDYVAPAAVASLVGFLVSFVFTLSLPDGRSLAGGGIAILVIGFIQAVAAVLVFLFATGIVKMPQGRPSSTHVHPAAYGHPQGYSVPQTPPGYGAPQGYGGSSGYPAPQGYSQQMPGYGQAGGHSAQEPPPGYPQQPTTPYGQFQAYQAQQPTHQMPQQSPTPPVGQQPPSQPGAPSPDAVSAPTEAFDTRPAQEGKADKTGAEADKTDVKDEKTDDQNK